ncbi:GNAT family N-acetyltransferase [Gordonia shandongensis]|uniref:GNAT family N-acetyltransferase n=1 Tax=Gordonia shandongensis TaxID=376351 RepID=UPI00040E0972|nr:GNAT family N-acetyltransferase [Gordonia shandongensis]
MNEAATTAGHPARPTPLDDPFTAALDTRQARFAQRRGRITRFDPRVSVFYGHPLVMTDADWADTAALAGPGATVGLRDLHSPIPRGWDLVETFDLVQYSGAGVVGAPDPDAVLLGTDDVPEMAALVDLTRPGPFLPRTVELGDFLGHRDGGGRLVAMAGMRLRVPGWVEISGVCTHPDARGQGRARRLIAAVAYRIVAGGDTPFLHTTADNPATRLYESMGFVLRSEVPLQIVRVPKGDRPCSDSMA